MKPTKKITRDTFEKVKEETRKAAEEVKPTKFAEDIAEQTGLKPQEAGIEQPQVGQPVKTQKAPADVAKKKAVTAQRLKQLEEDIERIRKQREREEEERRKGEVKEEVEAGGKVKQLGEEKKKELPAPVTAAVSRKTRRVETRIKGPSG